MVSVLFHQLSALFQHILALKIVSALIQQSAKKCPPYYSSQQKSVRLIPTFCLSALFQHILLLEKVSALLQQYSVCLFHQLSALFQLILTLKIVFALIQQSAKKCPPYYSSQQKSVRLILTSCLSDLLLSALVRFPMLSFMH